LTDLLADSLHQAAYIDKAVAQFNLTNARDSNIPLDPGYYRQTENEDLPENWEVYRSAIGTLLYLAVHSRPDIATATSILARKVNKPDRNDWNEVKRVLRYLKATRDYKLHLTYDPQKQLEMYVDADWASDPQGRKSCTGYCIQLFGGTISWASKKQTSVALSSTEAEFIALGEAVKELIWINGLLDEFGIKFDSPAMVYEDNQGCIKLLMKENVGQRSKHIDTRYFFVRDEYKKKLFEVKYCETGKMIADILTKPLANNLLKRFCEGLGLKGSGT